jgi:uncharacterized membrane protein HdeD (DUF308 family)/3',5'-cyclic AMP phosphodiesterase CpdA
MPPPSPPRQAGLAAVVAGLGVLAALTPLVVSLDAASRVGVLLLLAGVIEIFQGFRRASDVARRGAWFGGGLTAGMGLLLVNAPFLAGAALIVFLIGTFAVDGVRYLAVAWRRYHRQQARVRRLEVLAAAGNLGIAAVLLVLRESALDWTVALAAAFRILGTAWNVYNAPVFAAGDAGDTTVADLGLSDHVELRALGDHLETEEALRAPIDRGWVISLLAVLLAVHIGRMGTDGTLLGLVSPLVAVAGDVVMALLLAFAVIVPLHLGLRRLTRTLHRRLWPWCLGPVPEGRASRAGQRLLRGWLTSSLRASMRLRAARYSIPTALSRGLQMGLPLAAILAATVPVWGMSWYFDTENWAAGIWNSWAESRTDVWRDAMVRAVEARAASIGRPAPDFSVAPPGIGAGSGDFSFIVIGDTGEGDASQQSLRDQLIRSAGRDDVKFVVLSSDVVYPTGAMKDYETKFWLQFKGVEKPVYAIPGNHDWYDALEAFLATFLDADAARASIRARIDVDKRLTSTTEDRVESLVATAARLRREYRVPTGFQQAPFFQVQTDRFALIAADTGVVRRLDDVQLAWFRRALDAARGKMTMVVLGHPFYAGGHYTAAGTEDFGRLHDLLREYRVPLVMAGDTHDLEYYVDRSQGWPMHHVVNGGGGAYLSFGTALAWPDVPPTAEWAFFPTRAQVTGKIDAMTPWWKAPAWWWTRRFGAWPFSAEWLSAAFDYNAAPFFQSFVEVHVDAAAGRLRLRPIGVHGRLRWSEIEAAGGVRPAGVPSGAFVEWTIEAAPAAAAVSAP